MDCLSDWILVEPFASEQNGSSRAPQLKGQNLNPPANDDGTGTQEQPADLEPEYNPATKKAPTVETTTTSDDTVTSGHTAQPPTGGTSPPPFEVVIYGHGLTADRLANLQKLLAQEKPFEEGPWIEFIGYHYMDDGGRGGSHSQLSGCGATDGSGAKRSQHQGDSAAAHDDLVGAGRQFDSIFAPSEHSSDFGH